MIFTDKNNNKFLDKKNKIKFAIFIYFPLNNTNDMYVCVCACLWIIYEKKYLIEAG